MIKFAGNQSQLEEVTLSDQQNMFHKKSIGGLKVCKPEGVDHIDCVIEDKIQFASGTS